MTKILLFAFFYLKILFFLTFRGQEKVDTLFFSQKILDKNMHFVVYVIMLKEILMRDVNIRKKNYFFLKIINRPSKNL